MMTLQVVKPPTERERVVGIAEAARYLGVSRWTVRRWILAGKIPYVRYPAAEGHEDLRSAKVDLKDLDAFIDRNKDRKD